MKQVWKPNYKNVIELTNSGGALIERARTLCENLLKIPVLNKIVDSIGLVGYETAKFILCAKEKPYGWVVSCHEGLLYLAMQKKIPLVMYIGEGNKFYKFNPIECLENGQLTERAGKQMRNFNIKLGELYVANRII